MIDFTIITHGYSLPQRWMYCITSTGKGGSHEKCARVARPSLPCAGHAIHPALGKRVVWFTKLGDGNPNTTIATDNYNFLDTFAITGDVVSHPISSAPNGPMLPST